MVKLFCVNVGIPGSAFYIDIRDDAYVYDLNKAIIVENPNQFKNVDGYALQLFMAKKDKGKGAWLTAAEAADVRYESVSRDFEPINAARVLKSPDNFGEEFRPGDNQIHVLVVAPLCLLALYDELVVDDVNIRKTQSMMMNPPALVKFWRAFQEIPIENEADSVIALPEGTFILGDPIHGSRIYIRPCYSQLWEVCSDIVHDEAMNTPHLVILGNPGIGKTYFGYVILLYLARLGETVVYESRWTKKRFLFSRNVVVEGSQQDFDPILHLPTTYYIVDAMEPAGYAVKTILVTSPDRKVWYTFNKTRCQTRYMPVWSEYEILKCRELMYSDIPESVVQDCFHRWGGIPRYVLQYAQSDEKQILLEEALEVVDFDWLMNFYGKLYWNDVQAHRLLHYCVNERYLDDYFVFASQYVRQEVYQRVFKKEKRKLLAFLADSGAVGALAVLRGLLVEEHARSGLVQNENTC